MKFSIIVPTYNRKRMLYGCLKSLVNQDYPKNDYEIIVIDDGSTDGTEQIIKSLIKDYKNLRYFKIDHSGQAAARNIGLRRTKGKFIAFTDDDCVVEKNWLKKIEKVFKGTNTDAVGGSILNPTNRYIAWAQYILNFSSWFPKGSCRFIKDIPTANIAYRKMSIKGLAFPENLGRGVYEDSLFNHQLRKKRGKILFCPDIKVAHFTWNHNYGLKKFFWIQKKAAIGFVRGGYEVHGRIGNILRKWKPLNLFLPGLPSVVSRCLKQGYFLRLVFCFPLILIGELYKGVLIAFNEKCLKK